MNMDFSEEEDLSPVSGDESPHHLERKLLLFPSQEREYAMFRRLYLQAPRTLLHVNVTSSHNKLDLRFSGIVCMVSTMDFRQTFPTGLRACSAEMERFFA